MLVAVMVTVKVSTFAFVDAILPPHVPIKLSGVLASLLPGTTSNLAMLQAVNKILANAKVKIGLKIV
jgi:hypothetical protein